MGTGGNSHEAHTHRNGGGFIDRWSDRIGANNAAGHAAILVIDDAEHDSDDTGARRAAVNDDIPKHDEHHADAGRGLPDDDDVQQHNDDGSDRLPHAQGSW